MTQYERYIKYIKSNYFDNMKNYENIKFKNLILKGKAGGTPKSTIESYYNGEIPFLSIKDMTTQGKYINTTEKTITKEGLDNSSAWMIAKNSILYSIYASIGLVSINNINLTTSQAIYGIILKDNVNNSYIYHYLNDFRRFIHRFIETGTQGNINSNTVKNINIKLPPLEEQLKISNFFDLLDLKLNKIKNKIEIYRNFKSYLIQNMFI